METAGITENDIEFAKLLKCIQNVGGQMVEDVAKAMYSSKKMETKDGAMPLEVFMRKNDISVNFEEHDMPLLKCNFTKRKLDITFAYIVIREICKDLYESLSDQCKQTLKSFVKMRNEIIHDYLTNSGKEKIKKRVSELRGTLNYVYFGVAKVLNKGVNKKQRVNYKDRVEELENSLEEIMQTEVSISQAGKHLHSMKEDLRFKVMELGMKDISKYYDGCRILNPCTWTNDVEGEHRFDLDAVYTAPELSSSHFEIEVSKLLTEKISTVDGKIKVPNVIVIHGEAGSGKTSLCHFVVHSWRNDIQRLEDISKFQFVILVEIHRTSAKTFQEFLSEQLMRETFQTLQSSSTESIVMDALLDLEVLIVIDGYDEGNRKSLALVKDIFKRFGDKRIILTTRACALEDVSNIIKTSKVQHLLIELKGFNRESRASYIGKVFQGVSEGANEGQKKFEMYLDGRGKMLGKHLNLPLTIALLIVLWMDDPTNVNSVTTATSLYHELFKLFCRKLEKRLISTCKYVGALRLPLMLNKLLCSLGEQAWSLLKKEKYAQLVDELRAKIEAECRKMKIDATEFLSAFLRCEINENRDEKTCEYSFIHKTQTEYLAAFYLSDRISDGMSLKDVADEVQDWKMHEQLLIYLTGCLALKDSLKGLENDVLGLIERAKVTHSCYSYWWFIVSESRIKYDIIPEPFSIQYKELVHPKIGDILARKEEFLSSHSAWHPDADNVAAALRLIALIPVYVDNLKIDIPDDIEPFEILDFLEAIEEVGKHRNSRRPINMELMLRKHRIHTQEHTSDRFLNATKKWAKVTVFEGGLKNPKNFKKEFPQLKNINCRVTNPKVLECFIPIGMYIRALRITIGFVPDLCHPNDLKDLVCQGNIFELCFCGIKDHHLPWMLAVIRKLGSRYGITKLHLHESCLSYDSIEDMINELEGLLTGELVLTLRQTREDDESREEILANSARFKVTWN